MASPQDEEMIHHSRRIDPISRSASILPGEAGAIGLSRIPLRAFGG